MKHILVLLLLTLFSFGCTTKTSDIYEPIETIEENLSATPSTSSNKTIREKIEKIEPNLFDDAYFDHALYDPKPSVVDREGEPVKQLIYKAGVYESEPLMVMPTDGSAIDVFINDYVYDFAKYKDDIYYVVKSTPYEDGYYKRSSETGVVQPLTENLDQQEEDNQTYFEIVGAKWGIYKMNILTKEITKILDQTNCSLKITDFKYCEPQFGNSDFGSTIFLGINEDFVYMYVGNQIQKINQKTHEINSLYTVPPKEKSIYHSAQHGFVYDNNAVFVLKDNCLSKIDGNTNTTEDFIIPKEKINLETYELLKVIDSMVYFYNQYGKIATFNLQTNELIVLTQIASLGEAVMISAFVSEDYAYFLSYAHFFRFDFQTCEVTTYPPVTSDSGGSLHSFAVEPTEAFIFLMKGHSSGYSINKVYFDEMKTQYMSGFIDPSHFMIF